MQPRFGTERSFGRLLLAKKDVVLCEKNKRRFAYAASNKMSAFQIPKIPNVEIPMMTPQQMKELDNCNVDQHFSKAELSRMSAYEKKRYQNLKRNYLMLLKLGLTVKKPEFMQGPSARKRKMNMPVEDSDSDEEWTPHLEAKKKKKDKPGTVPFAKLMASLENGFKDRDQKAGQGETVKTRKTRNPKTKGLKAKPEFVPPSYPKRNRPLINYMSLEVPDDDTFLYCEECNKEYEGDCPDHGPLTVVHDSEEQVSSVTCVIKGVTKAETTVPSCLTLKTSSILDAGQGVFATKEIPARTRFGPYKGEITTDIDKAHETGYSWQIYRDGKPSHFVDASNPELSNWMRFVNCARTETEQNLTAFQYKGEVYYRSHVEIKAGQELLVWYGAEYGVELGIHRVNWKNKYTRPYTTVGKQGEILYSCGRCPEIQFLSEKYLLTHMKYKHQTLLPVDWNCADGENNPNTSKEGCSSNLGDRKLKVTYQNKGSSEDLSDLKCVKKCLTKTGTGEMSFQSTMSDYSFGIKNDLTSHVRSHTGEKPYKCTMCDYRCCQKGHLTNHVRTHTGEKPYKCTMCDYRCSVKGHLTDHVRTHTGEKPYKCTMCDYRCSVKGHLTDHVRTHTGEKPYKCTMCDYRCSQKMNLTSHVRIHTGEKPYKCTMCDYRCSQKGPLTNHVRTHTGEKPYKCTMCDYRCSVKGHLTDHVRTHTGEKPYKCTMCDYRCSVKSPLTQHVRTHTGEKPYKCTMCDYRCSQKGDLTKHVRTHTGEKPYKCTMCDYRCCQKGHLTKHVRTHTGEQPYKCTMCDYRCCQKSHLTDHVRTHTGEKPYKCTMCDYRCSKKSDLTKHVRTHTGEKPYKCTMCDYRCSVKSHLTDHVRTHTGEKPYKCSMCDYRCSKKSDLTKHVRTHTGEQPYKCTMCDFRCSVKGNLTSHVKTHHANTGDTLSDTRRDTSGANMATLKTGYPEE